MNNALKAAMAEAGETAESLAGQIGVDPKTAARWVNPGRIPQTRHRAEVAAAVRRDVGDLWPDVLKRREPSWLLEWIEVEREAKVLRSYQGAVLPGLVQTEAYARALLSSGLLTPEQVQQKVTARMDRQAILSRGEPPQVIAVVDEHVIRRPVGGAEVMREQLRHLVRFATTSHGQIQIVPSTVGAYLGLGGPFVLATLPNGSSVAYLDNQLHGQVIGAVANVMWIQQAWDAIRGYAMSAPQSIELIAKVAEESWT